MKDGIGAVLKDPFVNRKTKMVIVMWFLVVGLSPRPVALWAVKARHVPLGRPRILRIVLFLAGAIRMKTTELSILRKL